MTATEKTNVSTMAPVIGLEVHAQLLTRSKMFCGCSAAYAGAAPNTHICAVCAGMPGALPVINRKAVEETILTALALNCQVSEHSKFDRKNYSYPDLPKGYQISQYDMPIGIGGWLDFESEGALHRCGIVRVHLEEDTGKSLHQNVEEASLIDYNRSGVPLMEIVSEPDLDSPAAAREYFSTLRQVLMYLGVCDGNLQEGSMRADVNVSLRQPSGELGTKVEIKNLNSFRSVQRALEYEISRQRSVLGSGERVVQETRGWSERDEVTLSQRTKEYAHDYRYFPEPDLPPLVLDQAHVRSLRAGMAELPLARHARLVRDYGLSRDVAGVITSEHELADFYEAAAGSAGSAPGVVANWVTGDLRRLLNESHTSPLESQVTPERLASIVRLVNDRVISGAAAKTVLEEVFESGEEPQAVVDRLDLASVSDEDALGQLVDEILASNDALVTQYRAGKTKVLGVLVGKARGASGGKADPVILSSLLKKRLNGG